MLFVGLCFFMVLYFFFFKQKTAYERRISDWSSDVCSSDLGRPRQTVKRLRQVARYFCPRLALGLRWALTSRETSNYSYELTGLSKQHIAHAVAVATATPVDKIQAYFCELENDEDLRRAITSTVRASRHRHLTDEIMPYGRRLGWYAVVRATKPRVVVETGVDKGLGAMVLCAALLRNAEEDRPGRYFGTDINPHAGYLLQPPYDSVGEILYGDSLASLASFADSIDLFINDSDHSRDYERREYERSEEHTSELQSLMRISYAVFC